MAVYRVIVDGQVYTVEVPNPHGNPVKAIVNGEPVEVVLEHPQQAQPATEVRAPIPPTAPPPAARPAVTAAAPVSGGASGEIHAPLPGTVVAVSVAEGDRVERGQELCVLEAMKMNNPIRAVKGGTVIKVMVTVGQQVQHGAPLMVIEG